MLSDHQQSCNYKRSHNSFSQVTRITIHNNWGRSRLIDDDYTSALFFVNL